MKKVFICRPIPAIAEEMFKKAGIQVKIVANYAVGVDNIDIRACQAQGVAVTNTPEVLTEAVAEHVLALTLAVTRRVVEADRFTRRGEFKQWMPLGFIGPSLFGKIMGIIGMGRIGSLTGEMAH